MSDDKRESEVTILDFIMSMGFLISLPLWYLAGC